MLKLPDPRASRVTDMFNQLNNKTIATFIYMKLLFIYGTEDINISQYTYKQRISLEMVESVVNIIIYTNSNTKKLLVEV